VNGRKLCIAKCLPITYPLTALHPSFSNWGRLDHKSQPKDDRPEVGRASDLWSLSCLKLPNASPKLSTFVLMTNSLPPLSDVRNSFSHPFARSSEQRCSVKTRWCPRARALTGLSQKDFAREAGVNPDTLNRLKGSGAQAIKAKPATVDKLLTCLAQHNIALAPGRIIHAG
jgi:hypothetical protein